MTFRNRSVPTLNCTSYVIAQKPIQLVFCQLSKINKDLIPKVFLKVDEAISREAWLKYFWGTARFPENSFFLSARLIKNNDFMPSSQHALAREPGVNGSGRSERPGFIVFFFLIRGGRDSTLPDKRFTCFEARNYAADCDLWIIFGSPRPKNDIALLHVKIN